MLRATKIFSSPIFCPFLQFFYIYQVKKCKELKIIGTLGRSPALISLGMFDFRRGPIFKQVPRLRRRRKVDFCVE